MHVAFCQQREDAGECKADWLLVVAARRTGEDARHLVGFQSRRRGTPLGASNQDDIVDSGLDGRDSVFRRRRRGRARVLEPLSGDARKPDLRGRLRPQVRVVL
jgi:hypothetical protein